MAPGCFDLPSMVDEHGSSGGGCVFRSIEESPRQPTIGIRPLSPAKDVTVTAPSHWMLAVLPAFRRDGHHGRPLATESPQPSSKTSPSRANRVSRCALRSEHTDARKATVRRFGRSDRSAQRYPSGLSHQVWRMPIGSRSPFASDNDLLHGEPYNFERRPRASPGPGAAYPLPPRPGWRLRCHHQRCW
jgi:hypothetical protein